MALRDVRVRLGERLTAVWVLLSDTDRFLSRAGLMPRFESRVRDWRRRLETSRGDLQAGRDIRREIVAFRKSLREQGWELRLGSIDIQARGFRSDDSIARGFRRMVLLLAADRNIYFITGDGNHLDLDDSLRRQLQRRGIGGGAMQPHYLWYRVTGGLIEIAGADSEDRESFERLKEEIENRKSDLVRAFRGLS